MRGHITNLSLLILRCIFVMVAVGLGVYLINSPYRPHDSTAWPWLTLGGMIAIALVAIAIDIMVPSKKLDTISAVYFGIIVGLFLTYVVDLALQPLLVPPAGQEFHSARQPVVLMVGMVLCYTCISLLLQTKNDFRFIIPYVEFSKEVKGSKPYVLDTSVVIDGRIADVVETKIIDTQIIMPRFVLGELQAIADSSDRLRRSRGRRGLDILNRLRSNSDIEFQIHDRDLPEFGGQPVDIKLVMLAKHLEGKIITNDYNLNKVARLHGVGVINLNDLANSLKPVFLPGETMEVRIVKPGEEHGQGVGYLDDGTMVVVEGGRDYINQTVKITVTSVLQTSAGRMIFGKYDTAPKN